jgi:hypothetical protein
MIIDRCLHKNPDELYQQGAELAADLRKALERPRPDGTLRIEPDLKR